MTFENELTQSSGKWWEVESGVILMRIDVRDNPHVLEEGLVHRCMIELQIRYPRIRGWQAEIAGNYLQILVW